MRRIVAILLSLPLMAAPLAVSADADAVTGVWLTAESMAEAGPDAGYIQIYERDGAYHGRIVGAPNGETRKDTKNPDPAKRDRPLLGARTLKGFEYVGDDRWEGGRAYDPNNGKTYDANMWLASEDELKLRGYIGVSLFGRTETWTRVGRDAKGIDESALVDDAGD